MIWIVFCSGMIAFILSLVGGSRGGQLLILIFFGTNFVLTIFLRINVFPSFTVLRILSIVSTFMLSKRVKIFQIVCKNFFRSPFRFNFSKSILTFSKMFLITSKAPSVSSWLPSTIIMLVSSDSHSSKRYVGSLLFSVSNSSISISIRFSGSTFASLDMSAMF